METQYIIDVVDKLNWNLWEHNEGEHRCFQFIYMTTWSGIQFGEEILWNDHDDMRKFNEKTNEYEDLEKFIIREFNNYIKSCQRILKDIK